MRSIRNNLPSIFKSSDDELDVTIEAIFSCLREQNYVFDGYESLLIWKLSSFGNLLCHAFAIVDIKFYLIRPGIKPDVGMNPEPAANTLETNPPSVSSQAFSLSANHNSFRFVFNVSYSKG